MRILDDYIDAQRRLATADVTREVDVQASEARAEVQAIGERLTAIATIGVGLVAIVVGRQMLRD